MPPRDLGAPLAFAHYDRRRYRTLPVAEAYALWSRSYGELDPRIDLDLLERSALLAARVPGAAVLDLGCGNGRIGRWLADRGARAVTGLDRSPEMRALACARGVYAELVAGDVCATGLADGAFDGALCSLVLCHVADLEGFFAEAGRVLRPGGFLVVVDFHPVFLYQGVPTHFPHPDTGEQLAVENHVHPLRGFYQLATRAGFAVRDFEERFVTEEWAAAAPGYGKYLGLPVSFAWSYERVRAP